MPNFFHASIFPPSPSLSCLSTNRVPPRRRQGRSRASLHRRAPLDVPPGLLRGQLARGRQAGRGDGHFCQWRLHQVRFYSPVLLPLFQFLQFSVLRLYNFLYLMRHFRPVLIFPSPQNPPTKMYSPYSPHASGFFESGHLHGYAEYAFNKVGDIKCGANFTTLRRLDYFSISRLTLRPYFHKSFVGKAAARGQGEEEDGGVREGAKGPVRKILHIF